MIIVIMFDHQRYGRAHLHVHAHTHRGRLLFYPLRLELYRATLDQWQWHPCLSKYIVMNNC